MEKLECYEPVGAALRIKEHLRGKNVLEADLTDENRVKEIIDQVQPTTVFHFSALSNPRLNEERPDEAKGSNYVTTKNFVNNLPKDVHMIFPSSDKVFDGSDPYPDEDSPVRPLSYYGELKCQSEELVRKKFKKHHIVRLAAVHNWERYMRIYLGTGRGAFIDHALNDLKAGKEIAVFDGVERCFTRLEDLLELYRAFVTDEHYGTYNVGAYLSNYTNRIIALCKEEGIPWEGKIKLVQGKIQPLIQNMNTEKVRETFGINFR